MARNKVIKMGQEKRSRNILTLLTFVLPLSGCMLLPSHGPSTMDMQFTEGYEEESSPDYTVVKIDANVVDKLGPERIETFSHDFSNALSGDKNLNLGIGDTIEVNIWEASADGLFSTIEKKQTQIASTVDESGKIYIPYVGRVRVLGKSIEEVRKEIEKKLVGKAVEPQVQVALHSNISNNISIIGEIAKPGQYPVQTGGIRLIEAIAQAGGSRHATFDTKVSVIRGPICGKLQLDQILKYPSNNVWMFPKDTVHLIKNVRTFTAFGAVLTKNHIPFDCETLTIAEALAQAGGLNDNLADAGGVFLLRFETPKRLQNANIKEPLRLYNNLAATIYRLDFTEPQAFFLARSFIMQDKDIIYVANAPAAEFRKFVSTIALPAISTARARGILVN